jgi:hypothetical protein
VSVLEKEIVDRSANGAQATSQEKIRPPRQSGASIRIDDSHLHLKKLHRI